MGASNIHGIRDVDVQDAPTFSDIAGDVGELCAGAIIAAHNASFDIGFLLSEFELAGLSERLPPGDVLAVIDTLALSRSLVADIPNYKLATVCGALGIQPWAHHGALGDAKATAQLLAHLAQMSGGLSVSTSTRVLGPGWTGLAPSGLSHPRKTLASLAKAGEGRPVPTGRPPPLAGEVAVFTGGMGIMRDEAVRVAEALGCTVRPAVSGKTTVVVVGDPEVGRLSCHVGSGVSAKHRAALERAAAGQRLRVLDEGAFMRLAEVVSDGVITEEEWSAVRELVYSVGFAEPDGAPKRQARQRKKIERKPVEAAEQTSTAALPVAALAAEAGQGGACKTAGCTNMKSTAARQYCDLCRELRAAPNALRPEDIIGEKLFFGVAGVTRYPASREVQKGEPLYLVRDPGNPHDPLAIEVRRQDGDLIGYVPRDKPLQGRYGRREYTQPNLAHDLDAGSNFRLRCWAAGQGVQVEGDCEGLLVPYPARLEMWAKRGGDFGKPRESLPFEVHRERDSEREATAASQRGGGQEPLSETGPSRRLPPMLLLFVLGVLAALAALALLR
jgi:hypothetical protein